MKNLLRMMRKSEGASAIEYGLIAALITVAGISTLKGADAPLEAAPAAADVSR